MMDSRKDHPFADELQKCLRLADVSDFRSPHGRAYLEVVEKLLRAFETRGINIKSMMIAEQNKSLSMWLKRYAVLFPAELVFLVVANRILPCQLFGKLSEPWRTG